jgi:hypothetical protein
MPPHIWENRDFSEIFLVAFITTLAQVVARYITKLRAATPKFTRKEHFECLQLGVDFAFVGIVSGAGVLGVALKQSINSSQSQATIIGLLLAQSPFLLTEILLLLIALLSAAVYWNWKESYFKGIFLPGIAGAASIVFSVMLFFDLVR